ncbi:helix-turn-helix domain-containing protein [Microbulbifer bruguierae]|uniref:Helix-turn-helix domain-containing protein n=1 Tax=Microbulbifer bruguierae TaxID=3029061 RepID=A0ABY8NH19_9GAMM|nr:helix-turn-helix domain-containing protein [Microbulbifer bruguierae]WGL16818.1 helix-turn-helix domain-containing protein [Microbulbifer bruguierae]
MTATALKIPETFFHSKMFRGLGQEELGRLTQICQRRRAASGEYLIHQNSTAQNVYVVVSGIVMIERLSRAGRRQVISFAFSGDYIGFTNTDEFEYSVVCLSTTELQMFPRRALLEIIDQYPLLKSNARLMGGNVLAQAMDHLFAMGQKKAHERVCFLLDQIQRRQCGISKSEIDLVMSRQDIADYLGLTIETVSRALAKLSGMSVIEITNAHRIRILDRVQLEEMASVH